MEGATRIPGPGLMLGGAVVQAAVESVFSGAWQLLFWGALLVCTVAATVLAARRHAAPEAAAPAISGPAGSASAPLRTADRSDHLFWDLFMGAAVALPAILIPSLTSPWAGALLTAVGGTAGVAAYRYGPRVLAWQDLRQQRRQEQPVYQAAAAQHQALLARWRRYELDPACCICYPAITDVRTPETSALIRAMREAEQLRTLPHEGYVPAVARLSLALAEAEKAAGIPVTGR
jgi:hypothetical protein